jgi:hypothetical protein
MGCAGVAKVTGEGKDTEMGSGCYGSFSTIQDW